MPSIWQLALKLSGNSSLGLPESFLLLQTHLDHIQRPSALCKGKFKNPDMQFSLELKPSESSPLPAAWWELEGVEAGSCLALHSRSPVSAADCCPRVLPAEGGREEEPAAPAQPLTLPGPVASCSCPHCSLTAGFHCHCRSHFISPGTRYNRLGINRISEERNAKAF